MVPGEDSVRREGGQDGDLQFVAATHPSGDLHSTLLQRVGQRVHLLHRRVGLCPEVERLRSADPNALGTPDAHHRHEQRAPVECGRRSGGAHETRHGEAVQGGHEGTGLVQVPLRPGPRRHLLRPLQTLVHDTGVQDHRREYSTIGGAESERQQDQHDDPLPGVGYEGAEPEDPLLGQEQGEWAKEMEMG